MGLLGDISADREQSPELAVPVAVPVARLGSASGERPPLAFIHGLLGSNAMWRTPGLEALVSRHAAVALPLPGHHPWQLSPRDLADLLRGDRLVEAYAGVLRTVFDGRPVRLVGHSTGALIALEIARLFPELTAGVCLIGALRAGRRVGSRSLLREIVCLPVLGGGVFQVVLRAWLANSITFRAGLRTAMGPAGPLDAMPLTVMHDLRQSDPHSLHAVALWLREWRGLVEADEVRVPVFNVICADDPVVHPAQQLALTRALRRARSVVLPSGHLPMVEQPTAFCDALGRWLDAPAIRFTVPRTEPTGTAVSAPTLAL